MNIVVFAFDYMRWHYTRGAFNVVRVWANFFWFVFHLGSTGLLLKTLFAPWKRMQEEKPPKGHFDPEYYLGSILVNIIMRLIGLFTRLALITITFFFAFLIGAGGLLFIGFWFISPVAVPLLILSGVTMVAL